MAKSVPDANVETTVVTMANMVRVREVVLDFTSSVMDPVDHSACCGAFPWKVYESAGKVAVTSTLMGMLSNKSSDE